MSSNNPVRVTDSYPETVESLGSKFETLELVDRLIEENLSLKRELTLKTNRLRQLQRAVHSFLMTPDVQSEAQLMNHMQEEDPHEI